MWFRCALIIGKIQLSMLSIKYSKLSKSCYVINLVVRTCIILLISILLYMFCIYVISCWMIISHLYLMIPNWRCTENVRTANTYNLILRITLSCLSHLYMPLLAVDSHIYGWLQYDFGQPTMIILGCPLFFLFFFSKLIPLCASNSALLEPMLLWFDSDYSLRNGFIYFACFA